MDKYEYKLRLEEIKSLNRKGRFQEAAQVADIIDWKKVRNVSTLGIISDVYKVNRRFEDAKAILLLANELSPQNRRILYSICDLTIKMGQVVEAIEYYKEFVQVAPNDNNKYILLYKIYEAQDINLDERITVLKEYKKREYNEKWAYELAFLYHRVGLATECVEECDQLILWFGEGKYVAKAMELKMRYVPLSPAQQQAYERMFGKQSGRQEDAAAGEEEPREGQKRAQREEDMDIQVKTMDMGKFNTMNLQAALAESMKEVLEPKAGPDPRQLALYRQHGGYTDEEMYGPDPGGYETGQTYGNESADAEAGQAYGGGLADNTDVQAGQDSQKFSDTQVYERVTGSYAEEGIYGTQDAYIGRSEYGGDDAEYQEDVGRIMQASAGWDVQATGQFDVEEEIQAQEQPREPAARNVGKVVSFGRPAAENAAPKEAADANTETKHARFGRTEKMAMLLEQEYDGQIGMALPEEKPVEKQITGQMSIDDVLAEWENLRRKNEEKRRLETRKWMLQQTGSMFDDFDQNSRDGMLERLQREEALPLEESQRRNAGEGQSNRSGETKEGMPTSANAAAQGVMEETVTEMQEITGQQPGLAAGKERTIEELIREAEEKQREAQAVLLELERVRLAARRQAAMPQGMQQPVMAQPQGQLQAGQPEMPQQPQQSQQPQSQQPQTALHTGTQDGGVPPQAVPPQAAAQPLPSEAQPQAAMPPQPEMPVQGETAVQPPQPPQAEMQPSPQEDIAQGAVQQAAPQAAAAVPQSQSLQEEAPAQPAAGTGNTQELHERIREQQFEEHERNMTQDEKDLFSTFVPTKGAMRQLVKALDSLSLSAYTGNMIITGAPGSDMMKMAKSVVKLMRARDRNFSGKLAKVSGDVLNGKNPLDLITKIPNGALIVEKGGKLSDEGAENLAKALNQEQTGVIVFLLDSKRAAAGLMERCSQLAACFTARFDIAALDTATLVKYGCQYAYNKEYSIDEMGRLALHTRIEDLQTSDHAVTVEEVREIVDEAVDHAERFSVRHFMDVLFRKRYDDDDMIILGERDFI